MSDTNLPCGCTSVPHTCDTLPVGTTTYVCASVVCKTKTWGKCVLYGGDDIGCTYYTGGVSGFTKTGVGGDTATFSKVIAATGGSGVGATFTVSQAGTTAYTVTVAVAGSGYKVGDVLTITAAAIYPSGYPYVSPANDIVITITSLSSPVGTVVKQIYHEDDFDTIIQNLNDRICSATPSGLDYGTFNYTCLKQSGVLGTGTAIVTQQQFTESAAAALCAINTRVLAIEKPAVTVPTCFSGVITSGTSTLVQVLNEILAKVCTISTAFALPITISDRKCFTTAPLSTASVGDWFQWVVDNTCSINTTLTTSISTQTTRVNNINTYLHGTNSPSYPITYDISCTYMGGSATANLHTTVTALITKLCALGATVGGLPSVSSISMAWATCFSGSPYSYSNTATTLQTQLDRILNVISREKASYSTDFTVTDSACGKTVALASGALFDCSKLATCSITSLSDVTGTPNCGDVLTFDGTDYTPVERDEFLLIGGAVDGIGNVASYSGASVGPYLSTDLVAGCGSHRIISMGLLENPWVDLTSTIVSPNWSTSVTTNTFYGKKTFEGNIAFRGIISAGATILGVVNVPAGRTIATNLPTYLRPNVDTIIDGSVIFKANISNTEWALPGYFKITTGGAIIFFCNAVDPAAVTTRLGVMGNSTADHYFSFYGKVIYQ